MSRQMNVAMMASKKERPNTPVYWAMVEKFSSVKPPAWLVKAKKTMISRGATQKMAIR